MAVSRTLWGIYRKPRSPPDAAVERLARPQLDSRLDDHRRAGMGDGWLWYALGIILLVYGGPQAPAAVSASGAAALCGVLVFKALKRVSRRKRPCQLEPHCWSTMLPPDQFSLPSGHTMTAFAIALVVSYYHPSMEAPLFFLALSIAISRVVLGMHFLSDVLAGMVLGSALGCGAIVAFASYGLA